MTDKRISDQIGFGLKRPGVCSQPQFGHFVTSLLLTVTIFVLNNTACTRRPPPLPPPPETAPAPSETESQPAPDLEATAPELELRVEPSAIRTGESALLTWEARYADRVTIDHNIGTVDTAGKIKFFPEETTTYQVAAEGAGGRVEKAVTVEVLTAEKGSLWVEDLRDKPTAERFNYFVKPVFFGFDSAGLDEEAKLTLEGNWRWLQRTENAGLRFLIAGHCDERGTEEYNLALGDKRAQVVKEYMVALGIDPSRIGSISFGEERPFDTRQSEEAWALNRRAHFALLPESADKTGKNNN